VRIAAVFLSLIACRSAAGMGDDDGTTTTDAQTGSGAGSQAVGTVFGPAITKVVVEIDYETGQEPYTGPIFGFGDTFDPTLANIDREFAHKKQLTIPTTIAQMESIGSVDDEELTTADILTLASLHRTQHDSADTKTYYIVFVSGHYADNAGVQNGVLGVSIGNSGVVAMFKDVIRTTQSLTTPNTERYVEQSTLIHELSHAIGLVDNGVPMVAPHKDADHGAHCNNPNCVMYWLNEGASDASSFALSRLVTGSSIIFDNACLADVDAQSGGL
jgi:predicted Zn-dependent protease